MPTSIYPKEWKSRFIFVSAAMMAESPPLRDPKASIEDIITVLSTDEIVQWKRMYENPTRAFTFPEGVLAMGGLSPFYSVRPRAFFGKKEMTLWGLLQGDCRDVKFMVGDKVEPNMRRGLEKRVPGMGSSVQAGDSVVEEKDEEGSSDGEGDSRGSLWVKGSSNDEDDEDLGSRWICKRKASQTSSPKVAPAPRNIRLRLRSASGQKTFPATKAVSELPPVGTKGSLSNHLRSSSLVSEPLLVSFSFVFCSASLMFSKAPIEIPPAPTSSRARDMTPEISVARVTHAFDISPLQATGTSKPSHPQALVSQSPLAPLFAEGLSVSYIPKWKITPSTFVGTPETARDFLAHAVPPSHKFMNSALRSDLFDDQYSMSLCEGFFKGAGKLQRMDELRRANEELRTELKTSQTVAAELRCRVTDVERKLLEETGLVGAEEAGLGKRERVAWAEERAELAIELKHQKELDSVSRGIWILCMPSGGLLWMIIRSWLRREFKGSAERIYRSYRDVGYQVGLKDGYAYSAQGLGRKETPLYNSKAKKQLSKLDKEFGERTPALLGRILERPLMSIDELKALLTPAGPSSPKSPSGGVSQ
ncbi:hypothetical protein HanRHA438_Chr08g0369421 [Helianthus annuus]|nr:hypothetical protein HanHA300_Chr08g0295041 [Helianthus annuus]KAJ0720469.1 hypothetical protein HanLR1_Chr08g0293891 [Helianthus annuus]KAJ0723673.1 hypothetical protein HanOQP8_Chr08g0301121 [Helianthus annuus]KAJ0899513.1 hypothetical protein HanRHA438_Chr08g0369421 [Helianthus annuus]